MPKAVLGFVSEDVLSSTAKTIGLAVLVAGTLDLVANFVLWGLWKQISPMRICQAVATGFFGKASFDGGWPTAMAGVVTQYCLVLIMAVVLYVAMTRIALLRRQWLLTALGYGLGLYIVMNYIVVPLSASGRPYPWPIVWDAKLAFNLFCHIVLIALTFVVIFRRQLQETDSRSAR